VQGPGNIQPRSAAFLLAPGSTQLLNGWPRFDAIGGISLAPARPGPEDKGGFWVGVVNLGLLYWDGQLVRIVNDPRMRSYSRILGLDRRGRLLLSNGKNIAVYWPEKPNREEHSP